MTQPRPKPPALEDLPELYLDLKLSMERLEGIVRQLQAEGTRATLDRMAPQALEKHDINDRINTRDSMPPD